jgi:hypothetical protein
MEAYEKTAIEVSRIMTSCIMEEETLATQENRNSNSRNVLDSFNWKTNNKHIDVCTIIFEFCFSAYCRRMNQLTGKQFRTHRYPQN